MDLHQFLVELKDEDKENLFAEQIDDGSLDGTGQIMQSYRYRCDDATCANDEDHFSMQM